MVRGGYLVRVPKQRMMMVPNTDSNQREDGSVESIEPQNACSWILSYLHSVYNQQIGVLYMFWGDNRFRAPMVRSATLFPSYH